MDIDELKKDIQQYLDKFKELDINDYRHGLEEMNILNPYFGYSPKPNYWGSDSRGVRDIWMRAGVERLALTVVPRNISGENLYLKTKDLTARQLEGVHALVKKLHDDRLAEIKRTSTNPKLQDLFPKMEELAKKCAMAAGKAYHIELSEGRRQSDGPQTYHALVVSKDQWQIGSIPLRQDKWGKLTYNVQTPLSGSYIDDFELMPDKFEEQLKAAIEEVMGRRVNLDRLNSPVQDVVVVKNYRDDYYIACRINGEQQLRKKLSVADKDTYLYRKWNSTEYYIDELKYEMAEKYYTNEIALAQSETNNIERGR